jgi:hypothetical protein
MELEKTVRRRSAFKVTSAAKATSKMRCVRSNIGKPVTKYGRTHALVQPEASSHSIRHKRSSELASEMLD